MPTSYKIHTANGSAIDFTFAEIDGWISSGFLKIYINDILQTTGYSLNGLTTASPYVRFDTAPASGAIVRIQRETPATVSGFQGNIVNFNNGSVLTEADLDNMAKGLLHITQEAEDTGSGALGPTVDFLNWDAKNKRITNIGAPTGLNDAVSKGYVDGTSLYGSPLSTYQSWTFTGNGSTTTFTFDPAASTTDGNMLLVDVDGVIQHPTVNYTFANNAITFVGEAPAASASIIVRNLGAVRSIAAFNSPVTFNDAITVTGNTTLNGTLTAAGAVSFDGIAINNSSGNDSGSVMVGNGGTLQTSGARRNTALGADALLNVTTASQNIGVGFQAGRALTTGNSNTALGFMALLNSTTSSANCAFGAASLAGMAATSGSNNIGIGSNAGHKIIGGTTNCSTLTNSIFIGSDTKANNVGQSNQIVIGHAAEGLGSNTTVIGNSSTTQTKLFGDVEVANELLVSGTGQSTINGPLAINGNITGSVVGALASSLLPSGAILQVVLGTSTSVTALQSIGAGTFTTTPIEVKITPKRANSKIIIVGSVNTHLVGTDAIMRLRLTRVVDGVETTVPNSEHGYAGYANGTTVNNQSILTEDTPSAILGKEITYKVQGARGGTTTTASIGITNATATGRHTLIAVEVAI